MIKTELTYNSGETIKLADRVQYKDGSQGRVTNITRHNSRVRIVWDRKEGKARRVAALTPANLELIERDSALDTSAAPPLPPLLYESGERPLPGDKLIHTKTGLFAIVFGIDAGKHLVHVRWPETNKNRRSLSATEFRLVKRGGKWAEGDQS